MIPRTIEEVLYQRLTDLHKAIILLGVPQVGQGGRKTGNKRVIKGRLAESPLQSPLWPCEAGRVVPAFFDAGGELVSCVYPPCE